MYVYYLCQIIAMQFQGFFAIGECVAGLFAQCGQCTLIGRIETHKLSAEHV